MAAGALPANPGRRLGARFERSAGQGEVHRENGARAASVRLRPPRFRGITEDGWLIGRDGFAQMMVIGMGRPSLGCDHYWEFVRDCKSSVVFRCIAGPLWPADLTTLRM